MSKEVKNVSDTALAIPGVGIAEPGATIKVPDDFNNPNFKDVKEAPASAAPKPTSTGSNKK